MIVVLKPQVTEEKRDELISWFKELGLGVHVSVGKFQTILGLIEDTATDRFFRYR